MFDFAKNDPKFASEEGHKFEVKLPNGEGTGAFITVFGSEAKVVKDYSRKQMSRFIAEENKAKKTNRIVEKTYDEFVEDSVESAVVRTKTWEGFGENGVKIEPTRENFEKYYAKHDWIKSQVLEQSNDVNNF